MKPAPVSVPTPAQTRDDFPLAVKRVLAQRVATRCSICRGATTAPRADGRRTANSGVAMAITTLAPLTSRFDPTMSDDDRRSSANGIWVCQSCAQWIEDDTARFPVEELLVHKARAEQVALNELGLPDGPRRGRGFASLAGGTFLLPSTHEPSPHFVPKAEVQDELGKFAAGSKLVLSGLGGAGKTRHAVQYAHDRRRDYRAVLWASATSVDALHESLATVCDACELGIPIDPSASVSLKVRAVAKWLTAQNDWLLVVDSADSAEVSAELARLLTGVSGGRVLITSRSSVWPAAFRLCPVNAWTETEARTFLRSRAGEIASGEDALALCDELNGLPLVLEHAAAYMAETATSPREYRALLEEQRTALRELAYPAMGDYRANITMTWRTADRRLSDTARQLLEVASFLGSDPIPRASLQQAAARYQRKRGKSVTLKSGSPEHAAIDRGIEELAAYALVTLSTDGVLVHPVVQAVVRDLPRPLPWHFGLWRRFRRLPAKAVWEHVQLPVRVGRAVADDPAIQASGNVRAPEMRRLIPHVQAVLARIPESVLPGDVARVRLDRIVRRFLGGRSLTIASLNATMAAIRSSELPYELAHEAKWVGAQFANVPAADVEGASEWSVHETLREIARELAERGDVDASRRLFAFCRAYAADDYSAQPGDRARARISEALSIASLNDAERHALLREGLGIVDRDGAAEYDVLLASHLFAAHAETVEDRTRAVAFLRGSMPRCQELVRFDLAISSAIPAVLAALLEEMGDSQAALDVCEIALRETRVISERGRIHRASLWERRADILAESGRSMAAARSYRQTLSIQRRYGNPTALEQARLLRRGGEMCYQAARPTLAESQLIEGFALLDASWKDGPEYGENVAGLLGLSLARNAHFAQAESLFQKAVSSRIKRVGPYHASLAPLYRLHAISLHESGRARDAEPVFRRALTIARVATAQVTDDLARYFDGLAACLEDLGSDAEAVLLRDEARGVRRA